MNSKQIIESKKKVISEIIIKCVSETLQNGNLDGFLISLIGNVKMTDEEKKTIGNPNLLISSNNMENLSIGLAADCIAMSLNTTVNYLMSDKNLEKEHKVFIANRLMQKINLTIQELAILTIGDDQEQIKAYQAMLKEFMENLPGGGPNDPRNN